MLVATAIPKTPEVKPEEPTKTHYAGRIRVGDMIAKVNTDERMRNGSIYINYEK